MYGLESTVLMPLQSGAALHAGHPFYPADICAALSELPRPRALVTTPYHLRTLLAEGAAGQSGLPAADLLVSATAPLSANLAAEAEAAFAAPLYEIYGCTETGQLASRRTTAGAAWQTLAAVRLRREGDAVWAEGGHIDTPTRLSDEIELLTTAPLLETCNFLLHGRHADLVNIAGKRTSLGYLNHQLNAIPGVRDGLFLQPEEAHGDAPESVRRLTALVVAPDLTPAALMQALRERIDPIFLPRPLLFVDVLPRNAVGKLPSQVAQAFLADLRRQSANGIPA
jgi:acyl-coenzyme A synthetase/AMP-(fatty) acid ligase